MAGCLSAANIGQIVHRKTTGGSSLFVNRRPLPLVSSRPRISIFVSRSDLAEFNANTAVCTHVRVGFRQDNARFVNRQMRVGRWSIPCFLAGSFQTATGGRRWCVRANRTMRGARTRTQAHKYTPSYPASCNRLVSLLSS